MTFGREMDIDVLGMETEKATDPALQEVDWSLIFQICDVVNNTELGAKEARKLLQKKMLSSEPQTQVLALEILDALSENCRSKFQAQLGAKSFAEDLDTLVVSKSSDDRVHSVLVRCLQNWISRGGADGSLVGVQRVYDKLMMGQPGTRGRGTGSRFRAAGNAQPPQPALHQPVDAMNDVLLAKNNAQLFSQTLSFTDPTQEDITKHELIQEFYGKCKMFQRIISGHLETCSDSDVISSLLEANSELVTSFKAYDDMLERRALSEATTNSETLHNRSTRQEDGEQAGAPSGAGGSGSGTGYSNNNISSSNHEQPAARAPVIAEDPFDPFSDTNQVPEGHSSSDAGSHSVNLPPPLTPQRLHQ
ncbi:hypothetical protein BJV82DRAFT_671391 [Fennellomyces sp. T-0311]|nr:hypothetical protein BJV82DRAFT_671391 [Fennellomyces sp. T-0311]